MKQLVSYLQILCSVSVSCITKIRVFSRKTEVSELILFAEQPVSLTDRTKSELKHDDLCCIPITVLQCYRWCETKLFTKLSQTLMGASVFSMINSSSDLSWDTHQDERKLPQCWGWGGEETYLHFCLNLVKVLKLLSYRTWSRQRVFIMIRKQFCIDSISPGW